MYQGRQWTVLIALNTLLAGAALAGLVASPAAADPSDTSTARPGGAVAPDGPSALAASRQAGVPVEVLSRRTERERTFANPDGSWTSEVTAAPMRVRRSDGSWVDVDTTLRSSAGRVEPVAAVGNPRFSVGGSGPAARIGIGGREVSLGVPWPLPAPELSGSRATYRNVLDGVDLVLTAGAEGFSEVLVVRDRAAAANPALSTLRFDLAAAGLTLRARAGGFEAVDQAGRVEFTSPAARMWDSSGGTGTAGRSPDWPVQGDRRAPMVTSLRGTDLAVVPDRALLDDPATVFPVYLDPSVTATRNEWAMISSGFGGDDPHYKFSGDEGMGLCDVQTESTCNADQIKRLIWEFGVPTAVKGSHVLGATFGAYETNAYDCTADAVQLWKVGGISSSTTWDNHVSTWSTQLASVTIARRTGCTLGPGVVEFNATQAVVDAAAVSASTLALGLRAGNETSMPGGWKRFRYDATLSITYNSVPAVPTSLSAEGAGCGSGSTRPLLPTATPTLRGVVGDADGETDLKEAFAWQGWDGTAWVPLGSGVHSGLSSGGTGQYKISSGLVNNGVYRWHAQSQDPWSYNGVTGTDSSAWSGWCEFGVDTVGPQAAPGVSSPVYGTDLGQTYGAVGLTADFTFTASGVTDVTTYRWGWSDPPTTAVTAPSPGASVTLPLTPPPPVSTDPTSGGQLALYVVSVDGSGRASPMTVYVFIVGSATAPVGVWQMSEPAGSTTLADTTTRGTPHPATLTSGTAGVAGRILSGPAKAAPTAVSFNGSTSSAATSGPVLDTSHSFTVSTWARPTATKWAAVVSQSGTTSNAPFDLQYTDNGTWVFDTYSKDGAPVTTRTRATSASALNKWVHLVAVYDAGAKQTRLYVNGVLVATSTVTTLWKGTGNLQIGRVLFGGTMVNYFAGDIAEVAVWDRVVSAPELAPMAATLVGRWRLDGDGLDSTAYGRDANATDAVAWADSRDGAPISAASFNGVDQALTTAGPAVRTDQSFTVAGWVRWTGGSGARTAFGQDGTNISGFFLGCRTGTTAYWSLITRSSDSTSSTGTYVNSGTCVSGTWVHLATVRDAAAGQLRLYINGLLAASVATSAPSWQAGGAFTIGRAKWSAVPADFWTGDIDDVQVYAGALVASDIAQLAS